MSYYDTLGVAKTATPDEIKRAYRKLASQHHPDKGGDTAMFQQVEEAYRILSDPRSRQEYDNPQVRGNINGNHFHPGQNPFDFDTIFEMFGARMHPRHQQAQKNFRASVWIGLEDAVTGGSKSIGLNTPAGAQALEINIPPGVHDGENIRYAGLGPNGGDLVITFRIHPNHFWQRNGLDLYCERDLDFWQLILGHELHITTLQGQELTLTVPPKTRPGTMMRARAKGIAREGHAPGDLMIRLNAVMPDDIPSEIIEILEKRAQ